MNKNNLTDSEQTAAYGIMARLLEIQESVPERRNGQPLPPEAQAATDAVFAEARALGLLDDVTPSAKLCPGCGGPCTCA